MGGRRSHVAAAGVALAVIAVATAQLFRGDVGPVGAWRDYVTLTKPRIMSLLLLTGACGMFVGAEGVRRSATSPRCSSASRSPAAARARSTTCSTATSTS